MRALRYDGSILALDRACPAPAPLPGEALVRPTRVAIDSADLAVARGSTPFVGTLGHEFVGVVEAVNLPPTASPLLVEKAKLKGKRVVGSINIVCGTCDLCRAGLSTHCRTRRVLGLSGRDGCFADAFTLPLLNLHAVPDALDDDRATFAVPVAAALHTRSMFRVEGKPYITVLGDGRLGLLAVQAMARLNASVRLLGKHPEKFGLCERWGIKHRHIDDVGRRHDQDVVVDCTGSASGLELAMQLVRPRGKIVLKSPIAPLSPADRLPLYPEAAVNLAPLVINEIELVGSRCGSIPDALAALVKSEVQVDALITRRMKLDEGPAALTTAADKRQIKIVMDV